MPITLPDPPVYRSELPFSLDRLSRLFPPDSLPDRLLHLLVYALLLLGASTIALGAAAVATAFLILCLAAFA